MVEELPEVAHVCQPPFPVRRREHARGQILIDHDRLGQLGDPVLAEDAAPALKPPVNLLPLVLAGRGDPLGAPADERRQRRAPSARRRRRAVDRLEQAQPVARRGGREHAAGAVDHGGHARLVEGGPDQIGLAVGPHEHGDIAGADRLAPGPRAVGIAVLDLRVGAEQRDDVGREVLRDVLADRGRAQQPTRRALDRRLVSADHSDPKRLACRRPDQSRLLVGGRGGHLAVDDALVSEASAAEQRVVGVQ